MCPGALLRRCGRSLEGEPDEGKKSVFEEAECRVSSSSWQEDSFSHCPNLSCSLSLRLFSPSCSNRG
jgi:hypothetical protein